MIELTFQHGPGHDGRGWYYWETEYPEEGSNGAFATEAEARAHARENYGGD